MYESVGEDVISSLEKFRGTLSYHDKTHTVPIRHRVSVVELSDETEDEYRSPHTNEIVDFERMPSVMELLEFMGHHSLRYQIYMICNLLTISGFTQQEIAQSLGVDHQTYRNALLFVRNEFKNRTAG